ncbi:MAG: ABC transporter ATP-binding protein [Desulfurococcales archaeon]|nr:ABC transporter ATP-binding protein [Desulfurococcales archaeon]
MSILLGVENLVSGYGETEVLHGVSLKVERGTITTLLGSNGVGKTTTLWTISGILKAWSGKIKFNDEEVTMLPAHHRAEKGLILVPEGRRLWPQLTVYENLYLASFTRRAREKFEENLEKVFNLFPRLKERLNQQAGTLSGGEQQMLAIARGLVSNPEILMMDEPSLGLAPKLVQDIGRVIKRLRDEEGLTVLLVEQSVQMAVSIGDYGYVMENGRIVLEGAIDELMENSKFKQAYLGM